MIKLYLDGSSIENPGLGGYSCFLQCERYSKKIFKGFRYTTNNRMELLSMIVSLESLKKDNQLVFIYSDSKYVVDTIRENWINFWFIFFFKNKKNLDLWKRFWFIYNKNKINLYWIKSHCKNIKNKLCDTSALKSSRINSLYIDFFFENDFKFIFVK